MAFITISGTGVSWFFGCVLAVSTFLGACLMAVGGIYLLDILAGRAIDKILRTYGLMSEFFMFVRARALRKRQKDS